MTVAVLSRHWNLSAEVKAIVGILVAKKANIVRMTSILRIALDFRANAL